MGNPILQRIKELRENRPLFTDLKNANRYKLVAVEEDGCKTAYCFGVPVYTIGGKLLDLQFHRDGSGYCTEGSSCKINITDSFIMKNIDGTCHVNLECGFQTNYAGRFALHGNRGDVSVSPTTNGLIYKMRCENGVCRFRLTADCDFWEVRENNKYFSLMREEHYPAITVSCIGSADENGGIIAPALLESSIVNTGVYLLSVVPQSPYAKFVVFEVNMYEQKLFQDTTVDRKYADSNNIYGGTAFIGETKAFGEQWLYSRPDFSKLADLADRQISNVILHMNCFNTGTELSAFRIERRFCSVGSTWNNRIAEAGKFAEFGKEGCRYSIHLTDLTVDQGTGRLCQPNGFIVKTSAKANGFSVVSTGDNFYAPQILEIKYR